MKLAGSMLTLLGSIFGMIAAIVTIFFGGVSAALGGKGAHGVVTMGQFGILLSITLFVLAILAFSAKNDKIPIVILILSVTNIIVGGTFVAICMIINVVGAILLILTARKEMAAADPPAPKKRFYKQWGFWVSIAVLLFSIVFVNQAMHDDDESAAVNKDAQNEITPDNVEIHVTAQEMIKAYENNKVNYNARFAGKIVEVEGEVSSVKGSEEEFEVSLRIDSSSYDFSMYDVELIFTSPSQSEKDILMDLQKGDRVKAIGRVLNDDDNPFTDIQVINCKLVM